MDCLSPGIDYSVGGRSWAFSTRINFRAIEITERHYDVGLRHMYTRTLYRKRRAINSLSWRADATFDSDASALANTSALVRDRLALVAASF